MRIKNHYLLKGNENDIRKVMSEFLPDNPFDLRSIDLYTDDERHQRLLEMCKQSNIALHLGRFEGDYTKKELREARFLNLQMRTYCSDFAEEYGTKFSEENICKCCGSGKTQISDLYIDKRKMGKKDISLTYGFEVVISERLYQLLIENNITGVSFGNVHHKNQKLKDEPTFYQLFCTNTLPPLNNNVVFYKERYCECCKRSGLHLKSLASYNKEDLENAKDFNYTHEYFGSGLSGTPYIIISQKVYRLLSENKIKGLYYDIVQEV